MKPLSILLMLLLILVSISLNFVFSSSEEEPLYTLTLSQTAFAVDMYDKIAGLLGEDNFIFSPYSLNIALAMVYAGAEGDTEQQMKEAMHFSLSETELYETISDLRNTLASRSEIPENMYRYEHYTEPPQLFHLNIANRLWLQDDYNIQQNYLDLLENYFNVGLGMVDFSGNMDHAIETINKWVSDQTQEKIPELIPRGALDQLTRFVITNAIYFKANWADQFNEYNTHPETFYLINGEEIEIAMMEQERSYRYTRREDYQAIAIPYEGSDVVMMVLMPDEGKFHQVENSLEAEDYAQLYNQTRGQLVELLLPRWKYRTSSVLSNVFQELGMVDAFSPSRANFSDITNEEDIFIGCVIHEAYIKVNEEGTEAAAATAIGMAGAAGPGQDPPQPIVFKVDHPFIYYIFDIDTQSILFMGRVMNPEA